MGRKRVTSREDCRRKLRKRVSTGEKPSFSLNKTMKEMFKEAEDKRNPVKRAGERQGIWIEKYRDRTYGHEEGP